MDSVTPFVDGDQLGVRWTTRSIEVGDMEVAVGFGAHHVSKPLPSALAVRRCQQGSVMIPRSNKLRDLMGQVEALYLDLYVGGLREDARRDCQSQPFRIERAADGALTLVSSSQKVEAEMQQQAAQEEKTARLAAANAAAEVAAAREAEKAAPACCVFCAGTGDSEEGRLLTFRFLKKKNTGTR